MATCWNYAFQTSSLHEGLEGIKKMGYQETKESLDVLTKKYTHFIVLIYEHMAGAMPQTYHYIRYDNGIYSAKEGPKGPVKKSKRLVDMMESYLPFVRYYKIFIKG